MGSMVNTYAAREYTTVYGARNGRTMPAFIVPTALFLA